MKFKAIRLLTKTTFIYLIFVSVAFFTTAIFVTRSTNNLLYEETEVYFKHRERRLVSYIKDRDKDLDKANGLVRVEGNTSILAHNYPQYNDTIMELNQMDGPMLHRGKTILVDTSKARFLYTMYKNIND